MAIRCVVVFLLLLTVSSALRAGEMRTWTDHSGKSIEAKIVGFERDSLKLSRQQNAPYVNGVRYSQLTPKLKKVVNRVLQHEGLKSIIDAVPQGSAATKELKYLRVVFETKDGKAVKVPLDGLEGADDSTGDYKLALDESQEWLLAHPEKEPARPAANPPAATDPSEQDRRRLEDERRKLEEERKRFEEQKRRDLQDRRWRDDQDRRRWEDETRRRDEEHRRREEQYKRDKARADVEKHRQDEEAKARAAAAAKTRADAEKHKQDEEAKARAAAAAKTKSDAQKHAEAARKKQEEQHRRVAAERKKHEEEAKKRVKAR